MPHVISSTELKVVQSGAFSTEEVENRQKRSAQITPEENKKVSDGFLTFVERYNNKIKSVLQKKRLKHEQAETNE